MRAHAGSALRRGLSLASHQEAADLLKEVGALGDALGHHVCHSEVAHRCELGVQLTLHLTTTSTGNVTSHDLDLAAKIEALCERRGITSPSDASPPSALPSPATSGGGGCGGGVGGGVGGDIGGIGRGGGRGGGGGGGGKDPEVAEAATAAVHDQHTSQFRYELPEALIAVHPAHPRGTSRLLVHLPAQPAAEQFARDVADNALAASATSSFGSAAPAPPGNCLPSGGSVFDLSFGHLPAVLPPYAHLVFNHSRVFAARVFVSRQEAAADAAPAFAPAAADTAPIEVRTAAGMPATCWHACIWHAPCRHACPVPACMHLACPVPHASRLYGFSPIGDTMAASPAWAMRLPAPPHLHDMAAW